MLTAAAHPRSRTRGGPANSPRTRVGRQTRPRTAGRATALLLALVLAAPAEAQFTDYTELDLEQLSLVRISTLGRKQTPLIDTPAAATVITADDIHRSGAMDFAEALRQVPGLHVARINAVDYAISIRGFNDATSNKLLVLMDGRSLYSTTFSGAHWNFHELILEDVERIEVLRGPGASLWGANAMNGVINIVTKDGRDTIGTLVSVAVGDELKSSVTARHGWRFGANGAVRVYARHQDRGAYGVEFGNASGGWDSRLGGVRLDWRSAHGGHLVVIGEHRELNTEALTILPSVLHPPTYTTAVPEQRTTQGQNLSVRWSQPLGELGELTALATFEQFRSRQVSYGEDRDTIGLDMQVTLRPWERHEIIAGGTFRQDRDELASSTWTRFGVPSATTEFTGAFVQDDITLIPHRLSLTVGTKFERNSFSGWETQPSIRGIWRVTDRQRLWLGVSRAARTPSRSERSVDLLAAVVPPAPPVPLPIELHAMGSNDFDSEHLTSYELGHRFEPSARLSFDLALFHHRYNDLRGLRVAEVMTQFVPAPHVDLTFLATNNLKGTTTGGELAVRWNPTRAWTVEGSYSNLTYDLEQLSPSLNPLDGQSLEDPTIAGWSGSSPRHESKLRVLWDPHPLWSADLAVRHIGQLRALGVEAYTGVDLRVAWRWRPDLELELVGRDLLDRRHVEDASSFLGGEVHAISRSVFLRATWRH